MNEKSVFGRVPESITFGYKVLQIPTLEEMGIPMGGYGLCSLNEGLSSQGYDTCWIERGDPLLTYDFQFFSRNVKIPLLSIFNDPIQHQTFKIVSPISGLLLSTRQEQTLGFLGGLQYQYCNEQRLPMILVPNDEPPPDAHNFYVYDQIAQYLSSDFDLIPIRDYSRLSPERLRDWINRKGDDTDLKYLSTLRERNGDSYRAYEIREISDTDRELISKVQHLRGKDLQLREKLVHIARKYGESI